jgi:hypothetical protein
MEVSAVTKKALARCVSAAILLVFFSLSSCTYFPGETADLVAPPVHVGIQELPEITGCTAAFALGSCEAYFERVCGPFCWDEGDDEWRYCCRDVWRYTECVGDVVVSMTVRDPSGDLDSAKSPRVRILDSQPVPGDGVWGACQLTVLQTDVPISPFDVTGSGEERAVVVRIRNVPLRFTGECHTFRAMLLVTILFEDGDRALTSQNTATAMIEYSRR